jgi:glycosyltransferase involved in cell wall biosynthesis
MRLAILTEIPAPYRIPLFNALAERVDFRALFLAREDPRRPFYESDRDEWRFDHRFLPGRGLRRGGRWLVLNRGVLSELRGFRPDAVGVGGWNQPAFWQALVYCRLRRAPLLVWVESTRRERRPGTAPVELAKRLIIRGASGFFVPGRAASEYVRSFGVPQERVAFAPNAIDDSLFARAAVDRRGRKECTFLYAGRLDPEKCVDVLVRAFEHVPGQLAVAGSGSEEERLRALASDRVRFLGPLRRDELVDWYARADAFVLPSRSEPWGMVLNEAAAAALPIVATADVGAAHELIEDGTSGFRVPSGDSEALAHALRRLSDDEDFRHAAGQRSRELALGFTPEAWANGVAGLARRVTEEAARTRASPRGRRAR